MAGSALLVVALACSRRRLRREGLGTCGRHGEHEGDRQHRYPDHSPPIAGIRPGATSANVVSYFAGTVARRQLFQQVVRSRFPPGVIAPQQHCGSALAPSRDAGIRLAGNGRLDGRLAQLVERLLYTQDVGGSSPSPPTIAGMYTASPQSGGFVETCSHVAKKLTTEPYRASYFHFCREGT